DHRQADVVLGHVLVEGDQACLEHENVVAGFGRQQIDAAGDQCLNLRVVVGHEVVEGQAAQGRIRARLNIESLVGGPDTAGDETRLVGIAARVGVGGAAGNLCGRLVELVNMVLKGKLGQADRRGVKRAGLDDVRTGFQIGAMNVFDH